MDPKMAWAALAGTNAAEKLSSLGITRGKRVDIRTLDEISRTCGVTVYLFFEEDLARNRPLEEALAEFGAFSPYERPYVTVTDFLRFTRENDPSFQQTLQEFPLMVEIVSAGAMPAEKGGNAVPCVTGLMPFLDELDVDMPAGS
jgi:hypothetical protein